MVIETFPNCVSITLRPLSVPETILPRDDRTGSVQEEPLILHLRPKLSGRLGGCRIRIYGHAFSSNLSNLGA